eukprot:scaffold3784_cov174-Amphora_coffeaeformis.AAC.9
MVGSSLFSVVVVVVSSLENNVLQDNFNHIAKSQKQTVHKLLYGVERESREAFIIMTTTSTLLRQSSHAGLYNWLARITFWPRGLFPSEWSSQAHHRRSLLTDIHSSLPRAGLIVAVCMAALVDSSPVRWAK